MAAHSTTRRHLLLGSAALLGAPGRAAGNRPLTPMTDGPFYPPRAWRERSPDWDADLTQVQPVQRGGASQPAQGEHLALRLLVADTTGRAVDDAEVEIWQCDALQAYRHPRVTLEPGRHDAGFQGFGAGRSARDGGLSFRTIRPVPYPGRTPHIHVKLRHASFGTLTSQLFLAGEPGNARDFLWRSLDAADRPALEMRLQPAAASSGLRWDVRHVLTVPA